MRRLPFIIALLFGAFSMSLPATAQFRTAALEAIRRIVPATSDEEVELLAVPTPKPPFREVRVTQTAFDPTLGIWQLRLECVPTGACVPAFALLRSSDRQLFPKPSARTQSILVRAGEKKWMSARFGALTIRSNVTCLQSGGAGDEIRVRERDGRRVSVATVDNTGGLTFRRSL